MTLYDPRVQGVEIPIVAGTDLNNLITYGIYNQMLTANATFALHYPTPVAGVLEVFPNNGIQQRYTPYDSSGVFIRDYYNSAWSAWNQVYPTTLCDQSLYKYAPTAVNVFSFDSTHGLPSAMNTNQTYKIRGWFKSSAVSAVPILYVRFNGDNGNNYTYELITTNATTSTVTTSVANPSINMSGANFPNAYMVVFYQIEIMQISGDWAFVKCSATARQSSGSIWKFESSGTWMSSAAITQIQVGLSNVTTAVISGAELSISGSLTF